MAGDLVHQTWEWIKDPASSGLVTFYFADEADAVPKTPGGPPSLRLVRRRAAVPNGGGQPGGVGGVPAQQKKAVPQ